MERFRYRNQNPYGKLIPDCAVRAVSQALAMEYPAACALFGRRCVPGLGMQGPGISLNAVKKRLGPFFGEIEDANDLGPDPESGDPRDLGFSLDEFCDGKDGKGRFLVAVVPVTVWDERNLYAHVVYADLRPGRGFFYDVRDCGHKPVLAYMRVRAILDPADPRSLLHGRK